MAVIGNVTYPSPQTSQVDTTALASYGAQNQLAALIPTLNALLRAKYSSRPAASTPAPAAPQSPALAQAQALDTPENVATFGVASAGGPGTSGQVVTPWHPGLATAAGTQGFATGYLPRGYKAPEGPGSAATAGGGGGGGGSQDSGLESIERDMLGGKAAEKAKRDMEHANDVGPKPLGEYVW